MCQGPSLVDGVPELERGQEGKEVDDGGTRQVLVENSAGLDEDVFLRKRQGAFC